MKLYFWRGQKYQILHSATEGDIETIHLLSQREFHTTFAQSRKSKMATTLPTK